MSKTTFTSPSDYLYAKQEGSEYWVYRKKNNELIGRVFGNGFVFYKHEAALPPIVLRDLADITELLMEKLNEPA